MFPCPEEKPRDSLDMPGATPEPRPIPAEKPELPELVDSCDILPE